MSAAKKAVVYRMVMPEHVCPYGLKTVDLLQREGFEVEDHHLTTREETDAFKEKHGVKTTPQTFIGGKRIGGYDDLRAHFGKSVQKKGETSYQPVLAIFGVAPTFVFALIVMVVVGASSSAFLAAMTRAFSLTSTVRSSAEKPATASVMR